MMQYISNLSVQKYLHSHYLYFLIQQITKNRYAVCLEFVLQMLILELEIIW